MPVVFRWKGCKFFIFSNEGNPREPLHIHVRSNEARAKFWIKPVSLAENIGFPAHELSNLISVVNDNEDLMRTASLPCALPLPNLPPQAREGTKVRYVSFL